MPRLEYSMGYKAIRRIYTGQRAKRRDLERARKRVGFTSLRATELMSQLAVHYAATIASLCRWLRKRKQNRTSIASRKEFPQIAAFRMGNLRRS
jgi:hypothetical protein